MWKAATAAYHVVLRHEIFQYACILQSLHIYLLSFRDGSYDLLTFMYSSGTCIVSFIHRLWPPILPDTQLKLHVYQSSVAVVQKDKGQWHQPASSCLLRPIFGGSRGARSNGKGSPGRIMGRFKKRKGTWVGSTCKAN